MEEKSKTRLELQECVTDGQMYRQAIAKSLRCHGKVDSEMLCATLCAMSLRVCGSSFLTESKQNYIESADQLNTSFTIGKRPISVPCIYSHRTKLRLYYLVCKYA